MTSAGIPDSIRDYIYLDTDRARSIYSQLKGGLMESFMKGNATSESSTENVDSRRQSETVGRAERSLGYQVRSNSCTARFSVFRD